jgi:membrane protease YdiL (CAAX protease family)
LLVLCIFPIKKGLNLTWPDLGFAPSWFFFKQLALGLLLALVSLLPVFFILYALGVHVFDDSRQWTVLQIGEKIGIAFLLALLIGLFEEILFRGLLLTALRCSMSTTAAIAVSAFYYAELHFLKSSSTIAYADLHINSGFVMMAEAFGNLLNPAIFSALIALFVVGVFLGLLRTRQPQNLGLCIGCHCGWVWQIKVSKDLFNVNPQSEYLYLVSDYDGVIGPLVSVWLIMAMLVLSLITRNRDISLLKPGTKIV